MKQQVENSHKETMNLNETAADNVRKLHDAERENSKLKLNIEEVQHKSKKEMTNLRLEQVKLKGEENRAKEALNNKIEGIVKLLKNLYSKSESVDILLQPWRR